MWYIYTVEYYSAIKKSDIDGTGDDHVRWNNPDWKSEMLHVLPHMWNLVLKKW
jgi:hypothetical protein